MSHDAYAIQNTFVIEYFVHRLLGGLFPKAGGGDQYFTDRNYPVSFFEEAPSIMDMVKKT